MSLSDFPWLYLEDRSFGGSSLFVDLIPQGSWGQNARQFLPAGKWKILSDYVKDRCNGTCEICGLVRKRRGVAHIECHERWHFDIASQTQSLKRLVGLCASCHRATHFGFAQMQGLGHIAFSHIQKVNGWSAAQANTHIAEAFELWGVRSRVSWRVDVKLLLGEDAGQKFSELSTPNSPCIGVCQLNADKKSCVGCKRTVEEISGWSNMSEKQQRSATLRIITER